MKQIFFALFKVRDSRDRPKSHHHVGLKKRWRSKEGRQRGRAHDQQHLIIRGKISPPIFKETNLHQGSLLFEETNMHKPYPILLLLWQHMKACLASEDANQRRRRLWRRMRRWQQVLTMLPIPYDPPFFIFRKMPCEYRAG